MNSVHIRRTIGIYFLLLILSFCISAFLIERVGDNWEEWIRKSYYRFLLHQPVPSTGKVLIDANGIPFVEYTPYKNVHPGKQYLPTTVGIYAIDYYHELKQTHDTVVRKKFFNCIEWLGSHMTYHGNYALYEFIWQQPFYPEVGVPWTSGLSSGKAMEAFTRAYEISHDEKYIALSKWLLRGFYQPILNGGFAYQGNDGWWYEEYADSNMRTPRVLNGHVYAFLGVYRFWLATKDDSAAFIFKKGMESLQYNLHKYDAGNGWSYYDLQGKKSDKQYQKVIVELMNRLWKITDNEFYYSYYQKWKVPLDEYYIIRIIKERNRSGIILFLLVSLIMTFILAHYTIRYKSK